MPNLVTRPRCLVFAGKQVGNVCLRFMIDQSDDEICAVFTGSLEDRDIFNQAQTAGIPVETCSPEGLRRLADSGERYDWLVNLWCPHLLTPDILALARRRLNVHPGLVPHCRGNDAAAWALRLGLPAGVSLIEMTAGIDAGGVYARRRVPYSHGERGKDLHIRLQEEAIALFQEQWPSIRRSMDAPPPQETGGSYFTRAMTERDRVRSSSEVWALGDLVDWARAHDFSPGTTAEIETEDGRVFQVMVEKTK